MIEYEPQLPDGGAHRRSGAGPGRLAAPAAIALTLAAILILAQAAGVPAQRPDARRRGGLRATGPMAAVPAGGAAALGTAPRLSPLPFPPDRADRRTRPGEVPSLYADGEPCSTGCRPYGAELGWPLNPFHRQHPLRAGINELRPGSLHVGVDIQAPDGAKVYAVQAGIARVLEPTGPNARVQVGNYVYWHVVPRVGSGQPVIPFRTVLGTVMTGYGHIAFSELGVRAQYVNPLRPGGTVLEPYVNRLAPVIGAPAVASDGQVTVPAYSPQSLVERTTYVTPVLAPAGLAYRLATRQGVAVTPLQWAVRGTRLLPWALRLLIYAPGARAPGYACFATRTSCIPHWTYRLAGGLAPPLPTGLRRGRYRLTIYAWDWADNTTALDVPVTLTRSGWRSMGRFPRALFALPGYFTQSELLPPSRPADPAAPGRPVAPGVAYLQTR